MRNVNDIQDFDLMVGSVLRDAEVKAPSRVWRAVAARLDESPAPAPLWWKWAGASFAFAAALALTLVLTGTFRTPAAEAAPDSLVAETAPVTEDAPVTIVEAALDAEPMAIAQAAPVRKSRTSRREASAVTVVPTVEDSEPVAEVAAESQEIPAEEVSEETAGQEVTGDRAEELRRAWDEIIAEERTAARRSDVSLLAHGFLGSNNLSGGTSHPWMGSSGSYPSGIKEDGTSTYGIPVTIGAGVRFGLGGRLSIGTGLDYSLLTRTFTGTYEGSVADFRHTVQYIGAPLNLYCDLLSTETLGLYAFAGGEVEYCVSNKYGVSPVAGSALTLKAPVKGLQFSVGAGLGVEFMLADRLGLFIDPSVRYYFDSGQPKSARTERPLMFNFEGGLRFKL